MANGNGEKHKGDPSGNKHKFRVKIPQPQKRSSTTWQKGKPPPTKFKSRAENGGVIDPRINISGRPKLLSEAYKDWLRAEDKNGISNAAKVANSLGSKAIDDADHNTAKEMRQATEGDLIRGLGDADLDARIKEIEARIAAAAAGEGAEDQSGAEPDEGAEPNAADGEHGAAGSDQGAAN